MPRGGSRLQGKDGDLLRVVDGNPSLVVLGFRQSSQVVCPALPPPSDTARMRWTDGGRSALQR